MECPFISTPQKICLTLIMYGLVYDIHAGVSKFGVQQNKKIQSEFIYVEKSTTSLIHCASQCAKDLKCFSASYEKNGGSCEVSSHRVNGLDYQHRLSTDSSWVALSRQGCFDGLALLDDTCYYFLEELKNFTEAQEYCDKSGATLAEPKTEESYLLLRSYLNDNLHTVNYWFGLTDIDDEGRFVWISSGDILVYSAWGSGQPNNNNDNEDCVVLKASENWKWIDVPCHFKRGAICQI